MAWTTEAQAGARAVAPMLLGAIPFGLAVGATPVAGGLDAGLAMGLSTLVFAGASQLALVDIVVREGSLVVAVLAAWTINLRFVLYSASLAPHVAGWPRGARLVSAYLLTDQTYALCLDRWSAGRGEGGYGFAFLLGTAVPLWISWQLATLVGALLGASVPESIPLDFAVPLVFLVLLVPLLSTRPAQVAAATGGSAAVVAAELGAGSATIMAGAAAGIAAGAVADWRAGRVAGRSGGGMSGPGA